MKFEVLNALRDLDERTPEYLQGEVFCHGSLKVRTDAIAVLASLNQFDGSTRTLREMISTR